MPNFTSEIRGRIAHYVEMAKEIEAKPPKTAKLRETMLKSGLLIMLTCSVGLALVR